MDKYMLICRTVEHWPIIEVQINQGVHFFPSIDLARVYKADLLEFFPETLTDVQIYEYTGIQYTMVERWHKDV